MPEAVINGVRLHFIEAGVGEPLLLLHGIGASLEDWEFQMAAFARHFRVIAPDIRGFGASERQGPFTIRQFAADAWALSEHLGCTQILLAGHSMGGAVALQMAVDHPERVSRLVLADTLPSFRANTLAKRMMFATRYATMGLLGPRRLSSAIAKKLFPSDDQIALRERITRRGETNDRGVYLETIRGLVDWSVDDQLDRLSMPTLVIAAEFDYFPTEDAVRFSAALPAGRLRIFAGAHHALPLERPKSFNAAVLRFLRSQNPNGASLRRRPGGRRSPPLLSRS